MGKHKTGKTMAKPRNTMDEFGKTAKRWNEMSYVSEEIHNIPIHNFDVT